MNPGKNGRSSRNGAAEQKKQLQFRPQSQALFPVNYSTVPADKLRLAIDAVTRAGGALMFGITSDSGAFSIVVLSSEGRAKEYPHTDDELVTLLDNITEYYTSG